MLKAETTCHTTSKLIGILFDLPKVPLKAEIKNLCFFRTAEGKVPS